MRLGSVSGAGNVEPGDCQALEDVTPSKASLSQHLHLFTSKVCLCKEATRCTYKARDMIETQPLQSKCGRSPRKQR